MIRIDHRFPGEYIVVGDEHDCEGLMIHGYGGNKEELLGIAVSIAEKSKFKLILIDLPGHGELATEELTLQNASSRIDRAYQALTPPSFIVGHSLGARLGLMAHPPRAILLSMPGPVFFEGSKRELLNTLRTRRVSEEKPFSGLKEILAVQVGPAPETLLLTAGSEIRSAAVLAKKWVESGVEGRVIKDANHLDIINSQETFRIVSHWLKRETR